MWIWLILKVLSLLVFCEVIPVTFEIDFIFPILLAPISFSRVYLFVNRRFGVKIWIYLYWRLPPERFKCGQTRTWRSDVCLQWGVETGQDGFAERAMPSLRNTSTDVFTRAVARRGQPVRHVRTSQGPGLSAPLSVFSLNNGVQPKGFAW